MQKDVIAFIASILATLGAYLGLDDVPPEAWTATGTTIGFWAAWLIQKYRKSN